MVTPFCPTARWVSAYMTARLGGAGETDARLQADRIESVEGKAFAHCQLPEMRLSVPVTGGASVLKRHTAEPVLSEHGKWRREHLGAWNAAYGRTPFFIHLMPQIAAVYNHSEGITLERFNSELLQVALSWIDGEELTLRGEPYDEVRKELKQKIDDSLSIFDAIFRLGRETTWIV